MTNKEIAERLDKILAADNNWSSSRKLTEMVKALRYELDPLLPTPGTIVWWRYGLRPDSNKWLGWNLGIANARGEIIRIDGHTLRVSEGVKWKPAHILASDEVAVKVPPVSQWGPRVTSIEVFLKYWQTHEDGMITKAKSITRAEAECMEDRDAYNSNTE